MQGIGYLSEALWLIAVIVPRIILNSLGWKHRRTQVRSSDGCSEHDACSLGLDRDVLGEHRERKGGWNTRSPETHFVLTVMPIGYPEVIPPPHEDVSGKKIEGAISYEKYGAKAEKWTIKRGKTDRVLDCIGLFLRDTHFNTTRKMEILRWGRSWDADGRPAAVQDIPRWARGLDTSSWSCGRKASITISWYEMERLEF